jgi:hypothetical protein
MSFRGGAMNEAFVLSGFMLAGFLVLVLASQETYSLYSAQSVSGKNSIRGGSIELVLTPKEDVPFEDMLLAVGENVSFSGKVENGGENDFRYDLQAVSVGDTALCDTLHLSATRDENLVYSGDLASYSNVVGTLLGTGEDDDWVFTVSIPDTTPSFSIGETCSVSFRFRAWQAVFDAPGAGWGDEAELPGSKIVFVPESVVPLAGAFVADVSTVLEVILPTDAAVVATDPVDDILVDDPVVDMPSAEDAPETPFLPDADALTL